MYVSVENQFNLKIERQNDMGKEGRERGTNRGN
jgi:hypothetical protein